MKTDALPKSALVAAVLLLAGMAFAAWLGLHLNAPPAVIKASDLRANEVRFSAENALKHLSVIAEEPHSGGTAAHSRVRDYIVQHCREMGLETTLLEQTALRPRRHVIRAGRAQNIQARLRGSSQGKAILIMAHYDSAPNSPGAGDNGAAVAAMLENIRLLKSGPQLKNDVIFLFTDLEEEGLLGAEAFVNQRTNLTALGLVINFEARGSRGPVLTFEVSKGNGWLMRELRQGVGRAFASSISYEIYRRMPNDTDFTLFRDTGIAGFNNAFADGYSRYHHDDRIESLDPRSLQHHGEIMLKSLLHFGSLSLENTRSEDAIYFNPIGAFLVIYPVQWDTLLIAGLGFLFLVTGVVGWRKKRLQPLKVLGGAVLFPICLAASVGVTKLALSGVLAAYPHYKNFYGSHFYNSHCYLLLVAGLCLGCLGVGYGWLARRASLESASMGAWLLLGGLTLALKSYLGTGSYLLYYPLALALAGYLAVLVFDITAERQPVAMAFLQLLSLVPAWLFWIPFAYTLFIGFGFSLPIGAVITLWLCLALALPSLALIRGLGAFALPIGAAIMACAGLAAGHVASKPSREKPHNSSLGYGIVLDQRKACWISDLKKLDPWSRQHIPTGVASPFPELLLPDALAVWKSDAPFSALAPAVATILGDSTANGQRRVKMRLTADGSWKTVKLQFPVGVAVVKINDRPVAHSVENNNRVELVFNAPPPEGFEIELAAPPDAKVRIGVGLRRFGLPQDLLLTPLPENYINVGWGLGNSFLLAHTLEL